MIAEVIVDVSSSEVDRIFDYLIPDGMDICVGDRVKVSFGRLYTEGFVVGIKEKSEVPLLKPIEEKLDRFTAIIPEMIELMGFMQRKYNLRKADILRLFIPVQLRGGRVKELFRKAVKLCEDRTAEEYLKEIRTSAKQQRAIIEKLSKIEVEWLSSLSEEFGASAVNSLKQKGIVEIVELSVLRKPYIEMQGLCPRVKLTIEQEKAIQEIMLGGESLLFGVTGSGKTEVYLDCIEQVLKQGKTAIMLVPEISLTPQTMDRFRGRFGDDVALLHSGLSAGERFDEWLRLLDGRAHIAVGARSAIYAPLKNLGIIIIDEEHDGSYTSESNPRYDTKSIAEFRASYNNAILVKGSATPSIESYYRAKCGHSRIVTLRNRVNNRMLPDVSVVDMCKEIKSGNRSIFSSQFVEGCRKALDNNEQVMVFLNRRGYSSFMMCKKCGYVLKCETCDVSLTLHREDDRLKCHYCGAQYTVPSCCPKCGSESIRYGRDGTEKIVRDLNKLFPKARILRMDNDTTRGKSSHLSILSAFRNGEADILVGTQMIAKGHDFPKVTFVGILDADMSLYIGDYGSIEQTFQLVTQVAGRAGRDELAGSVVLQSYSPNHYVFYFASRYDYEGFYKKEINVREVTNFPPFCTIVRVLVTSENEDAVFACTKNILEEIKALSKGYANDFISLKAMKSPVKMIQNKIRYQVMMKLRLEREEEIISEIYKITDKNSLRNVQVFVELNPKNLN